jgi:hypothetical protein
MMRAKALRTDRLTCINAVCMIVVTKAIQSKQHMGTMAYLHPLSRTHDESPPSTHVFTHLMLTEGDQVSPG